MGSLLLGLGALGPWLPRSALSNPLSPAELWSTMLLAVGGVILAVGLGRELPRRWTGALADRLRGMGVPLGAACERIDGVLRKWPVACLALLALVVSFYGLMRPTSSPPGPSASAIRDCGYREERVRQQPEGRVRVHDQRPELAARGERPELDARVVGGIGRESVEPVVHRERHGHVRQRVDVLRVS